jgi:SCF-associated factor 1
MYNHIVSKNQEMDQDGDKKALASAGVIPCVTWDLSVDPIRLPGLPPLPELLNTGTSESSDTETRLIQIAAFDAHLVGLTNKGHVLKFGDLSNESSFLQGHWEYVSL